MAPASNRPKPRVGWTPTPKIQGADHLGRAGREGIQAVPPPATGSGTGSPVAGVVPWPAPKPALSVRMVTDAEGKAGAVLAFEDQRDVLVRKLEDERCFEVFALYSVVLLR
jgi:hypothetical protein